MPPMLLPEIRLILDSVAEACFLSLEDGSNAILKKLEWWLADGVFNHEPHGLFRTQCPYRGEDETRTVGEFLAQEACHKWEGMESLNDLFCEQLSELLEDWCFNCLVEKMGSEAPSRDEWENVYLFELGHALFMSDLSPNCEKSYWVANFLSLPLKIVEPWKFKASKAAFNRRVVIARNATRRELEESMVLRVNDLISDIEFVDGEDEGNPERSMEFRLGKLSDLFSGDNLEISLFVRSNIFNRFNRSFKERMEDKYPIPERWLEKLRKIKMSGDADA